jgi:hypothetical protein
MSLLEKRAYLVPKNSLFHKGCSEPTKPTIHYREARPDIGITYPHLEIDVPPCVQYALVVDRLAQPTCRDDYSVPLGKDLVSEAIPGTDLVVVKIKRVPEYSQHVSCSILDPVSQFTYTKRRVTFNIWDAYLGPAGLGILPEDYALKDYWSVPSGIILTMDEMAEADQVDFNNGTQDRSLPAFESSRVLSYFMTVTVSWVDTFQEQKRDIYLVVIGALIALGATTLIEGLRLALNSLLGSREL